MGRIGTFLFGLAVGGALVFGVQRYHLLHAGDGFHLVPKLNATFSEAYIDVRSFTVVDWAQHPRLMAAIIQAKKDHVLEGSTTDSLRTGMEDAMKTLSGS